MEQNIQFCRRAGNVSIAYATVGQGPAPVKAANWLSHLEYEMNLFLLAGGLAASAALLMGLYPISCRSTAVASI